LALASICAKARPLQQHNADSFQLRKWYADCINDSGDAIIAYFGFARWKKISLYYSCLLRLLGDEPPRAQYSIRRTKEPIFDGATLHWKSPAFRFEGIWKTIDPSHVETVFSSERGTVEWNCLQPRADAEVCFGKNCLRGLGYSEQLVMTIPPWEIPIQRLLWGRFLSDTDSLVWMDWRGPFSKRVLLHNGATLISGKVSDDRITCGAGEELTFSESVVLRRGALGSTALQKIPGAKRLLPRQILGVQETKWRSRARLTKSTGVSRGWAIHESVVWA
jgi:hypothetical protein